MRAVIEGRGILAAIGMGGTIDQNGDDDDIVIRGVVEWQVCKGGEVHSNGLGYQYCRIRRV